MANASAPRTNRTALIDSSGSVEERPARAPRTPRTPRTPPRSRAVRVPLDPLVEEFLEEVAQTLAPATERAYRGPITLYLTYLRETLGRIPDLADFTTETTRAWTTCLDDVPAHAAEGARRRGH